MSRNLIKYFMRIIQVGILVVLVVIVDSSNNKIENKILYDNYNKSIDLATMTLKLKEEIATDLFNVIDTYTGDLTGYVANCPTCSGRLACLPNYDVLNNSVDTYQDISYGTVRIIASSSNLSCGTIIRFNKQSVSEEPVIGIVLDRGVLGNNIDLLASSVEYARAYIGRSTVTYDVLRNGWQ